MRRWGWIAAIGGALLGTLVLYEALPGLNWPLWVVAVALGLGATVNQRGNGVSSLGRPSYILLAAAILVVAGTPVTDDGFIHVCTIPIVVTLLAGAMLTSTAPDSSVLTPGFFVRAPFNAARIASVMTIARVNDGTRAITAPRTRPLLRGLAIATPCVLVLALLLSTADPVFAMWRETVLSYVPTGEFVPKVVFFTILLVITLGAYTYAATATPSFPKPSLPTVWHLGTLELRMLLWSVAAVLYLFIVFQLGYFFGGAPSIVGTTMTYAEYAHRGFGELTVVAMIVVGIIVITERATTEVGTSAETEAGTSQDRWIRPLEYALSVAIAIVLASAIHRITLYESVYGYTTMRVYARAYAFVMMATVAGLSIELYRGFNLDRLFRQGITFGLAAFIALTWWNKEDWVVRQNVMRYVASGVSTPVSIDEDYLLTLSGDAVPAIIDALPQLPAQVQTHIKKTFAARVAQHAKAGPDAWYEWNYRRAQAHTAMVRLSSEHPLTIKRP